MGDTKGNSDTQGSADTKGSASDGDKPSKGPSKDKNEDDHIICKDLEVKNGDCKTKGKGKCRPETNDEVDARRGPAANKKKRGNFRKGQRRHRQQGQRWVWVWVGQQG